jgi:hypothetical protein
LFSKAQLPILSVLRDFYINDNIGRAPRSGAFFGCATRGPVME